MTNLFIYDKYMIDISITICVLTACRVFKYIIVIDMNIIHLLLLIFIIYYLYESTTQVKIAQRLLSVL